MRPQRRHKTKMYNGLVAYLADPEAMLAGDVRPPNCYLDAREILERQYVAYLIDRIADGTIVAPKLPRQIGQVMKTGVEVGSFLRR